MQIINDEKQLEAIRALGDDPGQRYYASSVHVTTKQPDSTSHLSNPLQLAVDGLFAKNEAEDASFVTFAVLSGTGTKTSEVTKRFERAADARTAFQLLASPLRVLGSQIAQQFTEPSGAVETVEKTADAPTDAPTETVVAPTAKSAAPAPTPAEEVADTTAPATDSTERSTTSKPASK
jgi:hypothetical protein